MTKISSVVLICAVAGAATADAQTLRGRVSDYGTREPVRGASAYLLDEQGNVLIEAATDSVGNFEFRAARAANYRLRVSMIGYLSFQSDRIILSNRETVQVAIQISSQPIPVTPVVVNARNQSGRMADFHRRRERLGTGQFITQADIEKRPLTSASTLLLGVPGVSVISGGPAGAPSAAFGRSVIKLRSTSVSGGYNQPNECTANVFLDGRPIQGSIDDYIIPDWIGGVEIYANELTTPSEFQRGNGCGSVVFWTKDAEGSRSRWTLPKIAALGGIAAFIVSLALD
jgi:hypothetical protein